MSKTHVYFMPGMAAGKEIFKNIRLPEEDYEIHLLEWQIPEKDESIQAYAKRMAEQITEPSPVLVGVSFGGVLVQEMAAFLDLKKLIIISSVKSQDELPLRLKVAKTTKAYKLVPTQLASSVDDFTVFAIGPKSKKRLRLYNEYLSVRDKTYLDWAIDNMVNWKRKEIDPQVIHIHGDQDAVFPIRCIKGAHVIEGGTHVMILNKAATLSKLLQNIMEEG